MHPADFRFLEIFPNGLLDEEWINLGKKHSGQKIVAQINEELSQENFKKLLNAKKYEEVCLIALKLLRKATVVSVFEKVAFSNYLEHEEIKKDFSIALYDFMYKLDKDSFEKFVLLLARYKSEKNNNCAKWTVVTFFIAYLNPSEYAFVKPTTTKAIAKALDCDIDYTPYPTYETYEKVLAMIEDYRKQSDLCKELDMMMTEAVLYCSVTM